MKPYRGLPLVGYRAGPPTSLSRHSELPETYLGILPPRLTLGLLFLLDTPDRGVMCLQLVSEGARRTTSAQLQTTVHGGCRQGQK